MKKINCEQCGAPLTFDNVKDRVAFCPSCGNKYVLEEEKVIKEVSNTTIIQQQLEGEEEIKMLLRHANKLEELKKYDGACKAYQNIIQKYSYVYDAYLGVIRCFDLYRQDPNEVLNVYMFQTKLENEMFEAAFSFKNNSIEKQNELHEYYEKYVSYQTKELDAKIKACEESINEEKIEIEKLISVQKSNEKKLPDWFIIATFGLLVIGAILGFAFNEALDIVKFIGYILIGIGVIMVFIYAIFTPSSESNEKKIEKIKYNMSLKKMTLDELKEDKEKISVSEGEIK